MIKRILTTTIAGTILTTGVLFGATATASSASAAPCPSGSWNAVTLGVPSGAHPGMNGVAVFRKLDNDVFSVVMSTNLPSRPVLYTGSITSDGPISYRSIRTETGDVIRKVAPNKIVFAMTNKGHLDGLNVTAPCSSTLRFTFNRGTHRVATGNIALGSGLAHPSTNPFAVTKS